MRDLLLRNIQADYSVRTFIVNGLYQNVYNFIINTILKSTVGTFAINCTSLFTHHNIVDQHTYCRCCSPMSLHHDSDLH